MPKRKPLFDTGPIRDWQIIFKFCYKGAPYQDEFYSVPQLRNYFKGCPERGVAVGYGRDLPQYRTRQSFEPVTDCKLSIWYVDHEGHHTVEFADATAFAKWLDQNPAVAHCVSYRPRK